MPVLPRTAAFIAVRLVLGPPLRGRAERRIAVPALRALGVDEKDARGLGNVLLGAVSAYPATQVTSESDMVALLGLERQKQMLGCEDDACLAQIGGALGVQYLVTSELSVVASSWVLSLALLDVRHARTLARVVRRTRSLDETVENADPAVRELLSHLPELATKRRPVALWLLGGGAAVTVAGGLLYGLSWSRYSDAQARPGSCDEACASTGRLEAGLGVGGLAVGLTSVVIGLLWPRADVAEESEK